MRFLARRACPLTADSTQKEARSATTAKERISCVFECTGKARVTAYSELLYLEIAK